MRLSTSPLWRSPPFRIHNNPLLTHLPHSAAQSPHADLVLSGCTCVNLSRGSAGYVLLPNAFYCQLIPTWQPATIIMSRHPVLRRTMLTLCTAVERAAFQNMKTAEYCSTARISSWQTATASSNPVQAKCESIIFICVR